MTDYAVGIDYINKFHATNKTSAKKYVDWLYSSMGRNRAIAGIESLGAGIKAVPMSESEVQTSVEALATQAKGKVPKSVGDFRFALVNQATATPFIDSALAVAQAIQESAPVQLATSVWDSANFIAKLNSALPFLLPIGLGFIVYKTLSSDIGKAVVKKQFGV